jgi:hypothetical protein
MHITQSSKNQVKSKGQRGFFGRAAVRFLTGFTDCANQNEIIENDCTHSPQRLT